MITMPLLVSLCLDFGTGRGRTRYFSLEGNRRCDRVDIKVRPIERQPRLHSLLLTCQLVARNISGT